MSKHTHATPNREGPWQGSTFTIAAYDYFTCLGARRPGLHLTIKDLYSYKTFNHASNIAPFSSGTAVLLIWSCTSVLYDICQSVTITWEEVFVNCTLGIWWISRSGSCVNYMTEIKALSCYQLLISFTIILLLILLIKTALYMRTYTSTVFVV